MKHSRIWERGLALAGGLMLVPGTPALFAGDASSVDVVSARVVGDTVEIVLANGSGGAVSGVVVLLVQIDGTRGLMSVPFTIEEGQKTFVHVPAAGAAVEVIQVGVIVDDGTPF